MTKNTSTVTVQIATRRVGKGRVYAEGTIREARRTIHEALRTREGYANLSTVAEHNVLADLLDKSLKQLPTKTVCLGVEEASHHRQVAGPPPWQGRRWGRGP